jgi:hypothetical protein
VALVHQGRLQLAGEPSALLAEFTSAAGPQPSAPTFETLFLARLEQADREAGVAQA